MSSLDSDKTLAGIGSILLIFPFVNIIGVILVYVGIKGLSDYYKDSTIYHDALRGFIFLIIAAAAIAVAAPVFVFSGMFSIVALGPFGIGFGLISFLAILAVVFIFYILAAMNLRKAFNTLAQKSSEHMFETAGLLLFLGAIMTVVLVGFLLIFVAWIIATIAFFSIKIPTYTVPQTVQPLQASRCCPNCGAPQNANAIFCSHCGRQLPPA